MPALLFLSALAAVFGAAVRFFRGSRASAVINLLGSRMNTAFMLE